MMGEVLLLGYIMTGTVIGVHYDGWVLLLGYIMTGGTVIGVHYDGGYCYWGTL